ncbi:hypothetical protein [Pantoea sp. JKS000250]|uniref:hypothetical protein n=1 Tax=Pantoea sp. JKS000250 TaxID=1938795 RepID=UPI000D77043E|nr:hypothetical protein [Pantoea sp. JKS000250]PXW22209.1 hypothetical protein BY447_3952 [Pantoea sp. JKS000250]
MDFREFEARVMLWPAIHFTAIIQSRHHDDYEIYAVDDDNNIKTRLFLCFADNESHASLLIKQFMLWLIKINAQQRRKQRADRRKETALLSE